MVRQTFFSRITAVWEAVANLSYDHYQEHFSDLVDWLDKKNNHPPSIKSFQVRRG